MYVHTIHLYYILESLLKIKMTSILAKKNIVNNILLQCVNFLFENYEQKLFQF